MKIAISSTGKTLADPLDGRFGRTKNFILWDSETKSSNVFDNVQNLNTPQGAGIQAAMNVAKAGAAAVITGHCGPNAAQVLREAGIKVYLTDAATGTEALDRFNKGLLKISLSADVNGHWA